jgi:radical SAM superfamily enzyme YgiQ (UPF0313 family)
MKIVFVTIGAEYIGVELMAAMLKQAGHQVQALCDESVFDDKNYFTVPPLARLFERRSQVVQEIVGANPGLVGISVITNGYPWALEIARGVKALRPDIPVILGGVHVTSVPEHVIAQDCVDMICVGEGHHALVELADSLEAGAGRTDIQNIWFKLDGEVIRNPQRRETENIEDLPLLDKSVYEGEVPLHLTYLALSQWGCPFACSYCAVTSLAENSKALGCKPWRMMSVDKVIAELKHYRERYNFDSVFFMTNTFTADKNWVQEWAQKYPAAIGLPYKIATHPTKIDLDVAKALKSSGCYTVQLGVESYSEEVRAKIYNRRETNEQVHAATKAMDDAGLRYTIDYILGGPLQSEQEYHDAAEFFITLKKCIRITPFIISFFPRTPLVEIARAHGMIAASEIERLEQGLDPNFVTSGSLSDPTVIRRLNAWRLFFRLIPILPTGLNKRILERKWFRFFEYLPTGVIVLFMDVVISFVVRDYVALGYLRTYAWNVRKVIKRKFGRLRRNITDQGCKGSNAPVCPPPAANTPPTEPAHGAHHQAMGPHGLQ